MFSHIILFKFKDYVAPVRALELLENLGEVTAGIPEVKAYRYGENDRDNSHNQQFDYAFVMDFTSKVDRYSYQDHPDHLSFIETYLNPHIADAIVFDMENISRPQENNHNVL